jgi:ABC-type multidrug transport system ATPase subunit
MNRMGFVTQDDILHQHLTVKETLIYAALLRLPRKMSRTQKCERAMEVLHRLGLEKYGIFILKISNHRLIIFNIVFILNNGTISQSY